MTAPKRPRDTNQLAKAIVDIATGEEPEDTNVAADVNEHRRRGGLSGGKARALKLTEAERSDIARIAAEARWKKS